MQNSISRTLSSNILTGEALLPRRTLESPPTFFNEMNNDTTEKKLYTWEFLLMNVMNFIILTGNGVNFIYPLNLEDIGKDKAQVGYIMGAYAVAAMISRFVIGPQIDRLGRKFFVRAGLAGMTVCYFLYTIPITGTYYLLLVRVLHGFTYGAYFTAMFTWAADYAPKGRMAESIGIYGISGLLTISSGPFVSEKIVEAAQGDYDYMFYFAVAAGITGLIISHWMKEVEQVKRVPGNVKEFLKILVKPGVSLGALDGAVFGVGVGTAFTFAAPFVREMNLGKASVFFTAYMLASISIRLFSGRLTDRLGKAKLIIPGFFIMAMGQAFMYLSHNTTTLFIFGLLQGAAHGTLYPALSTFMIDRVGKDKKGTATGLFNASTDVGYLSGASLAGFIAHNWGFEPMYATIGMIIFTGLLIFSIAGPLLNQKHPEKIDNPG